MRLAVVAADELVLRATVPEGKSSAVVCGGAYQTQVAISRACRSTQQRRQNKRKNDRHAMGGTKGLGWLVVSQVEVAVEVEVEVQAMRLSARLGPIGQEAAVATSPGRELLFCLVRDLVASQSVGFRVVFVVKRPVGIGVIV